MNTRILLRQLAVAALFVAASLPTQAQVANTLLDLGPGTGAYDVMVDPFNPATHLFVAARIGDNEVGTVLHVDLTLPVTATQVDQAPGRIDQIGVSYSGALFTVGSVYNATGNGRSWQVRRSLDQGATWSAAGANYQYKAGAAAFALGFASDNAGKVFACGYAYSRSGGNSLWIVRRSADQGVNWTTHATGRGPEDAAFAVHFVPYLGPANHGGLFVVGRFNSLWTVQRSRDGGSTWTTVDSWSASRNATSVAKTITSDTDGNLYVAGHSYFNKEGNKGYVRRSSNGGDSWGTILENFGAAPTGPVLSSSLDSFLINKMKFDKDNTLWTIGTSGYGTANSTWTMLRWNTSGGWMAPFTPYGSPTFGKAIATDAAGNVYGLGAVQDVGGSWRCVLMQTSN